MARVQQLVLLVALGWCWIASALLLPTRQCVLQSPPPLRINGKQMLPWCGTSMLLIGIGRMKVTSSTSTSTFPPTNGPLCGRLPPIGAQTASSYSSSSRRRGGAQGRQSHENPEDIDISKFRSFDLPPAPPPLPPGITETQARELKMRAHLERMRVMQEEAEAALRFIYSGSEGALRRLQTLCNPDRTFDMDVIEAFESRERELDEVRRNTTARHQREAEARRRAADTWREHPVDSGSSAVQAAFATERIKQLTAHLLRNKHDESAKRGLHALVTLRRKNLEYLYHSDPSRAQSVATGLGVRFTPPGRHLFDRSVKYAAYHNTRARDAAITRREKARARRLAKGAARPVAPPTRA